jgi:hypothetical protein
MLKLSLETSEADEDLAHLRRHQQRRHSHQPFLKSTLRPSIVNIRQMNQQLDLKTGLSPLLVRRVDARAAPLADHNGFRRSPDRRMGLLADSCKNQTLSPRFDYIKFLKGRKRRNVRYYAWR